VTFSKCVLRGDSAYVLEIRFPTFGLLVGVKGTPLVVDNSPRGLLFNVRKLGLFETCLELVETNFVCFTMEMLVA
jgi:hypothetical protein